MTAVQHRNTNGTSDATNAKKRKGFWSNVFGRSSNAAKPDETKYDQQPEDKGFMSSLMGNARQGVTNVAEHVAEDEAKKYIEAQLNNTDGSQPTNTNTATVDATSTTPSDVLNAPTNWAKRMMDSAQQKVQNLQQDLTPR